MNPEFRRVGLASRHDSVVIGETMWASSKGRVPDENCRSSGGDGAEMVFGFSAQHIAQHCTFRGEWSVPAGEVFSANVLDILSKSPRHDFRLHGPHNPFVCPKN